jgi:hypothetical protein
MPVYVDEPVWAFRNMMMCHMIADTPAELHEMADRIGIQRRWFQEPPKASFWHYDVARARRDIAVAAGAVECDRNEFVGHLRRIRASRVFESPHEYTDFQMHFEDCPDCTAERPCEVGRRAMERG